MTRLHRLIIPLLLACAFATPAIGAAQEQAVPTESELVARVASLEAEGEPSAAYIRALVQLSGLYINAGRHSDAVPVLRRAVAASGQVAGPDHPVTREIMITLLLAENLLRNQGLPVPEGQ